MPKGTPRTEEEQKKRRKEIRDEAVKLFYKKGFPETSMREIAEAAGVGKSTLYDYFQTKDEILISYFVNEIETLTAMVAEVFQRDIPAYDKLHLIMQNHLAYMLENKNFYLKLTIEAQRLNMENQTLLQQYRHVYQDMICRLVEDGIREGAFRKVDPMLAMRLILASLTPVVFTTRPSGTPQDMMKESIDIILNGISA